jgi:hypothetical protein
MMTNMEGMFSINCIHVFLNKTNETPYVSTSVLYLRNYLFMVLKQGSKKG